MNHVRLLKIVLILASCLLPVSASAQKAELSASINRRSDASWQAALKIWQWAEPGYQETKSSGLLAKILADAGFRITQGVADIPTAFT
ncbi:MAG: amidohydrolase, partial [Planctomycetota bacterium]|nr:amidohydrolase [Planctomycetota bacterium]